MRTIHLTPQLVQAVRDATEILDVAGDHTRLTRRGNRHHGLCPLHKEKTPSFSVDPSQGLFYCFGCGAGGDAIRLHMLLSGDDFPAAVETLAQRYGIPLPAAGVSDRQAARRDAQERRIEAALEAALRYFQQSLRESAFAANYLAERQISPELIQAYGLGYAREEWRGLIEALSGRVPLDDLKAAGLVVEKEGGGRTYDRFRHRLIFPIHTAAGRLVGFGGRTLGDDRAKYINTSETDRFHKGHLLYGLHQAKKEVREEGRVLLVEGYFDVIGAAACEIPIAVASMGTALTPEQARMLARYADEVILGYDGDAAGEKAARRAVPLLLAEGLAVRRADFGEGEDPDSLRLKAGVEAVQVALEKAGDALGQELDRLVPADARRDPHAQAKAADQVAEALAPVKDTIVRLGYARRAAERLGIPVDLLLRRIKAAPAAPAGPRSQGSRHPEQRPGAPSRYAFRSKDEGAMGMELREPEGWNSGGPPETNPGGDRPRGPAPAQSARPSEMEESVLRALMSGEGELPPVAEMPPAEVFFDSACRNIFRVWCTLYRDQGRRPPVRDIQEALTGQPGAIDRIAKILLERHVSPGAVDPRADLDRLRRRWLDQRRQEVRRELVEAQRAGDSNRIDHLSREMKQLSQEYYKL